MISKSKNSDFDSRGFIIGIFCCALLAVNLVIAHTGIAKVYFLAFSLASIVLLVINYFKSIRPVLVFFLILAFPEYGPDPYNKDFVSPFYFQKYVFLILCIIFFNLKLRLYTILYLTLLILSWLLSYFYEINGRFLNEIIPLFILICLLNIQFDYTSQNLVSTFLLSFIAFCFISSFIIDLFGISVSRINGGKVYFYGHWFGILSGYFLLNIGNVSYSLPVKSVLIVSFIFSIYININAFQSAHFVWLAMCIFILFRLFSKITFRSIGWAGIFGLCFYFLQSANFSAVGLSGQFAWASMKGLQLLNVFAFDLSRIGNSPLIRLNEMLSLVQQSSLVQLALGRGFASTYEMNGAYWALAVLHDDTFPIDQLKSGSLQMVHESVILLFKWTGLVGAAAVLIMLIRIFRRAGLNLENLYFGIVLVALFLLSGVQTGILCLMLLRFNVQKVK